MFVVPVDLGCSQLKTAKPVSFYLIFVFPVIEEEGLFVEDTVQTPDVESPPPQELPVERPSPEPSEVTSLPEPPVEAEASGSGAEKVAEVELTLVHIPALEEHDLEEVIESEIPEELEISTISTETIQEEGLASLVPVPEVVDLTSEMLQPEGAEVALLPVGEIPAEDTMKDPNLTHVFPDEAVFEESETTVTEEKKEEPIVLEEEIPEAPMISTEDLTEDEILLVNMEVTDSSKPAQPTTLSPEKESHFTQISDLNPASDVQPDIIITTTTVEVIKVLMMTI